MSLSQIAVTSQGPMVGDYISTSFIDNSTYTTAVDIGKAPYERQGLRRGDVCAGRADHRRLGRRSGNDHRRPPFTGQGTGETHHALRDD